MNAVIAAVGVMLILSLSRVHVVIALIVGALVGGLTGGLGIDATLKAFNSGLGGGATVALSYALLGAFAVAIAKSGLAHALADKATAMVDRQHATGGGNVKWLLIGLLWVVAIASQNILPIHIAFIPLLVPPLLYVLTKLQLDRRLIACVMTFGLITPYMFLPVGFGNIFLNEILLANVARSGVDISGINVTHAMGIPALGMVFGLAMAFISYRKKRVYDLAKIEQVEQTAVHYNPLSLMIAGVAIASAFVVQLLLDSMIIGALVGFLIFSVSGIVKWRETDDLFTEGMKMMAMIGFIMIAASGFAEVMKATGQVQTLVESSAALDQSQQRRRGFVDAAGGLAGDHGHRFVVLHRADSRSDFRAVVRATGLQPDRHRLHRWHCRCAGRCRFAGLGLDPRPDLGPEHRRPASPHLGHRRADLPALQPAAAGVWLGCGDGSLKNPQLPHVGASLLAKASCQSTHRLLSQRFREQARSHRGAAMFQDSTFAPACR